MTKPIPESMKPKSQADLEREAQERTAHFRLEAEENAAKMERRRIEHLAAERGVTVAEFLAQTAPKEDIDELPKEEKKHVKESIKASEQAAKHAH